MLGKASEIKTILLPVDEINEWLESWPDITIIDIQYQMGNHQMYIGDGEYRREVLNNAMIIYKEPAG